MRLLLWHVHGSWTTSFVHGRHDYLLPVLPDRGPDGRGRARTWQWPAWARELTPGELAGAGVDAVVLQRPHELELAERWLGRRPGRDLPAVYVEHDAPSGAVPDVRHPLAEQSEIPIVHVTGFNQLMWDNGRAPTRVVDHGIVDPGHCYTGELPRAATAINEPVRRGRTVGTDLLDDLATVGVDVFGMGVDQLPARTGLAAYEDLPQEAMHRELARRRVYVHTSRWTSLGLSLIEAMQLGMPVVVLGTTEAPMAVPADAGIVTTRWDDALAGVRRLLAEPETARAAGRAARRHALTHFGLDRFLTAWDEVLADVTGSSGPRRLIPAV